MSYSSARGRVAVVVAALALTVVSCSSEASPEAEPLEPVRAVDLAAGGQDGPVDVEVGGDEGVQVSFREITIEPGASTGEHCHHGQLLAVVKAGELTHYARSHPGGVRVYRTGESIIEGAGYPHEGFNEGKSDVVLMVTYVIEDGEPLAETDLERCDG